MMIGVAQVIGMKPTFRSFFSGVPASANASVTGLDGEELRDRAQRGRSADRFQECPACGIPWKHRTDHSGSDNALITLLFALYRLAAQRQHRMLMFCHRPVLAAHAARPRKRAVSVKRIVEGGHAPFPCVAPR